MDTMIRTALGACAMLLAGLVVTSGPAAAKATMACKAQHLTVTGNGTSEAEAKSNANQKWKAQVGNTYGQYWADLGNAAQVDYSCKQQRTGGYGIPHWLCSVAAAPCAPVKAPSASKAQPKPPSTRATTELDRLPAPSDPETRTTSSGRRTGTTDQPGAAVRLPSPGAGQRRDTPAPSSGITGPPR